MNKHLWAGLLALGLFAGCSQSDVAQDTRPPAVNTTTTYAQQWDDHRPLETTLNVARADDTAAHVTEPTPATGFTKDAYQGSLKEVSLGELALRQSSSAKVQAFAQMMIRDHGKAVRELEKISAEQGLSLQAESALINESEDDLSRLTGHAFDQKFADMMVEDHEKDLQLFEREARDGLQQSLSEFAAEKLPILRQHLEMARELRESLGDSSW